MEIVQGYVGLMSAIDMKFEALHDMLLAGRRENQDGFHKVNENISNIMNVQILLCRDVAMLKEESAALRVTISCSTYIYFVLLLKGSRSGRGLTSRGV